MGGLWAILSSRTVFRSRYVADVGLTCSRGMCFGREFGWEWVGFGGVDV